MLCEGIFLCVKLTFINTFVQELKGLGLNGIEKRLSESEQTAEAVTELLKELGESSIVPGMVLERLMVLYLKLKVSVAVCCGLVPGNLVYQYCSYGFSLSNTGYIYYTTNHSSPLLSRELGPCR